MMQKVVFRAMILSLIIAVLGFPIMLVQPLIFGPCVPLDVLLGSPDQSWLNTCADVPLGAVPPLWLAGTWALAVVLFFVLGKVDNKIRILPRQQAAEDAAK